MTNEMKKVPELRFTGFEEEWEEKKLERFSDIGTGKSKIQSVAYGEYANLGSTGIIGKSNKYDYEGDFILTARVGHYAGKLYKYSGKVNISDNTIYLQNIKNKNFVFELLNAFKLERLVFGTGQPLIKSSDIKKLKVLIPTIEEQKKIGDFFSKLDRQIELEEQKLEKLEEQKKGYMQKIFSQELRFKNDKENNYPEWEVKQLKEILEFSNKRTTKENEYPILTSSRKGLILQSDYYKEGKTFADSNVGYFILPKNFITYRSRSDDGIFKFNLNQIIDTGIISKYYPVFKGINSNQYYLALHLNNQLKKEYIKYATGTSQLVLSHKNLQEIKTKLPFYDEQTKIADFLIKFDELIEKQNQKIDGLKSRKKGFLQKMFV